MRQAYYLLNNKCTDGVRLADDIRGFSVRI